jgi:hypothetical protein
MMIETFSMTAGLAVAAEAACANRGLEGELDEVIQA